MMHRARTLLAVAAGVMLGACASAPVHFHTLLPPAGATGPAGSIAAYDIAVLPVVVPADVDRPQMVIRVGSGSVMVLDGERWIAPLGDQIRAVISDVVSARLGAQDVFGLAGHDDKPVYRIKIQVGRFESIPGQYTLLQADWSVTRKGSASISLQCASRLREAVAPGYAALIDGLQRGLVALGQRIAQAISALVGEGKAATCPPVATPAGDSASG